MVIQFILILAMLVALGVTWRRASQHVITAAEALGWSLIWIGAIVIILLPNVTTRLAQLVGVGRGSDLVLYVSVVGLFMLVFRLFVQHEKVERTLTELIRLDALRDLKQPYVRSPDHARE